MCRALSDGRRGPSLDFLLRQDSRRKVFSPLGCKIIIATAEHFFGRVMAIDWSSAHQDRSMIFIGSLAILLITHRNIFFTAAYDSRDIDGRSLALR